MKLLVYGVPRAAEPIVLDPSRRAVAVLGRETDENRGQLDIALPHIDLGGSETATIRWSREHARFEFVDGRWLITFLGREPTFLSGRQLVRAERTPLNGEDSLLECGGLTLRIKRAASANDTLCGEPARPMPAAGETLVSPASRPAPFSPIKVRPVSPGGPVGPSISPERSRPPGGPGAKAAEALAERMRDLSRQIAADATRARAAAQDAQQQRQTAEAARDEVQRGLPEVRGAALVQQVQDAARRTSEAAARAQTAAAKSSACAESAERALEACTKHEHDLRGLMVELRAAGMTDRSSADFGAQLEDQKCEAERYVEQAGQHRADARRASEQAVAAARAVATHNESVQKAASERQGELLRKDRALVAFKRYSFIALLFLIATAVGLFIGSFVEPKG